MLGSRKLLIFVLCLVVVGSIFVLSMFAEDRVRGDDDLVFLRSASDPNMILSSYGLTEFTGYLYDEGYDLYSHSLALSFSLYLYNTEQHTSTVVNHVYVSGGVVYAYASGSPVGVESPLVIAFDSEDAYTFFTEEVGLSPSEIVFRDSNTNIINASMDIGDSIFAIGGALVAFVTSSWITIVALVAVLLILGVGVIRKLVKGV